MKRLKKMMALLLVLTTFGCTSILAYAETTELLKTSGNGPYFLGAGIAVLVFIGVAIFCKFKGNQ